MAVHMMPEIGRRSALLQERDCFRACPGAAIPQQSGDLDAVVPPVPHDQIAELSGHVGAGANPPCNARIVRMQPVPECRNGDAGIAFGQEWMLVRGHMDAFESARLLSGRMEAGIARSPMLMTERHNP